MDVDKISCPFRGRDGCNSGGGKGLSKKYLIDHLGTRHFGSKDSRRYLGDRIASDNCLFPSFDIALKKAGIWLCGKCWRTHSISKNCKHTNGMVILAPTSNDVVIYGIPRPSVASDVPSMADEAPSLGSSSSFDVDLLGRVFLKPFRTIKSFPPNYVLALLGFSSMLLMRS